MKILEKIGRKIETNVRVPHPRLLSIAIYAGVALATSAAMGFVLYPEQQHAFAVRKFEDWWY
jgi:hypothetical protein